MLDPRANPGRRHLPGAAPAHRAHRARAVILALAWTTGALAAALAIAATVATARARRLDDAQLVASALLEVALLVQGVVGVLRWVGADRDDGALFIPYLLTAVLVMPLGVFWAIGERSRYGTGVLAFAAATEVVLVLRTHQVWVSGG